MQILCRNMRMFFKIDILKNPGNFTRKKTFVEVSTRSQCTFYKPENMGKPQGKGGSGTNGLITPFFREHLRWLLLNMLSKDFLGDWVTRNVFSFGFSPWLEVLMLHVCFISSNGKTKYFICHVFSLLFFFYVMATRNVGGKTMLFITLLKYFSGHEMD